MKYSLCVAIVVLFSCSNDEMISSTEVLDGKWLEKINRLDNLVFDAELNGNESRYFIFKCKNGKSGYNNVYSAIYEYRIDHDKISLYNAVSSCYCFSEYSFT